MPFCQGKSESAIKSQGGATITTYVFVNNSDRDSSLLGKEDAVRLGIVTVNLAGSATELDQEGWGVDQRVNRLKMLTLQDLQLETSVKQNDDTKLFGRVGKYKGPAVKIQLKEGVQPVIQPPRRIPLHYVEPLNDHLKELLEEDVIEGPLLEEEEDTWISNLVITDKKWDAKSKQPGERVHIRAN